MPTEPHIFAAPSQYSQRLDILLHHMDSSQALQSLTSKPSSPLPPRHSSHSLSHSSSYSTSLTSHQTAAPSTTVSSASDSFQPRRLQRSDFGKGFLSLLSQLTDVGEVSEQLFNQRFDELTRISDTQQVWIIEDVEKGAVIATATLLVELKFIHGVSKVNGNGTRQRMTQAIAEILRAVTTSPVTRPLTTAVCGCCLAQIGHIEDVVVSGEYRGKNLGFKSTTSRTHSHPLTITRPADRLPPSLTTFMLTLAVSQAHCSSACSKSFHRLLQSHTRL